MYTGMVGLVLSSWKNRYLLENLEGCMEATAASLAGVAEADTPASVVLRPPSRSVQVEPPPRVGATCGHRAVLLRGPLQSGDRTTLRCR